MEYFIVHVSSDDLTKLVGTVNKTKDIIVSNSYNSDIEAYTLIVSTIREDYQQIYIDTAKELRNE